jgi:hypothetical protein
MNPRLYHRQCGGEGVARRLSSSGELVRKKCGNPLSAAELEEERKLRVSIGGARVIGARRGGLKQAVPAG